VKRKKNCKTNAVFWKNEK